MQTLEQYQELLAGKTCRDDGAPLDDIPIEAYNHDGGWPVEGFPEKQWLYVICPKCGYQWALWKLGVPR